MHLTGQSVLAIVPQTQDPGRLLAYAQLWCPATARTLGGMAADAKQAILLGAQKLRAAAERSQTPAPDEASMPKRASSTRIALSFDLESAALRFEAGALERHLCLTRDVHLRTAAAVAAHSAAADDLESLRGGAVARAMAAVKRGGDPGASQVAELPGGDMVHAALLRPLIVQHRCAYDRGRLC